MSMGQNRREFLKASGIITVGFFSNTAFTSAASNKKQPNIIYILTDQQNASMMSCTGNKWLKTPAMDYIAKNGIRFKRTYPTNPVCLPSRISMLSGRFPTVFKGADGSPIRQNKYKKGKGMLPDEVKQTHLGAYMKKAGYELYFGGKRHVPSALEPSKLGFNYFCKDQRQKLAEETAKLIKSNHDKPYFIIVSLINPHDICYMVIREYADPKRLKRTMRARTELATLDKALKMPEGVTEEEFFMNHCPPLPDNYQPQKDEPKGVAVMLDSRDFRRASREKYEEKEWRLHRWAYARLTEMVDKKVQIILDAIKQSGQEQNTLVMFSSDHGDMDSAHRMEGKSALYEESANVPFMAMWKGHIPPARVDDTHLVSNGLDLLPTICDYAGIKAIADPRGKSLRPLFEGKKVPWRSTLGVEAEFGRMLINKDKLKYIRYDARGTEEQLLDMNNSPLETDHVTDDPKYAEERKKLRKSFNDEWFPGV